MTSPNLLEYVKLGKFYQAVVEDGSDIIFITDFDGNILYHNDSVGEVLGHPSGRLVGKKFFDYILPSSLESFRSRFTESLQKPYNEAVEFQFLCNDESYKYLEFNSINLKQKEGLEGLILDCRDITERKKDAEELLRAQKAKEQFLANISHEIRTPINGIAGMAELLSQDPTDEEKATYLNAIKNAADNLKVIINDILDIASIESGKLKFEKIGFNVRNLLSSLSDSFSVQARQKGIELKVEIDPAADIVLLGDPVRLNQILINLISNAIKFTHVGSIRIECSVERKQDDNYEMQFVVRDTGIGIPKDKLDTIFERFSQADESVTRKYGGTGLGLTIVRQLVEMQQGSIHVESEENKGSVFSVVIPYRLGVKEDVTAAAMGTGQVKRSRDSLKDLSVLLVEDNDINRLYASSILKTWECTIDTAENGYVALEKIRNGNFDVVLMDIQMPVMDGFEATKAIRMGDPSKNKIPIIALTANATPRDIEKCLASGMNDCIPKPFTPEDLFTILLKFSRKGKVVHTTESVDLSYLKRSSASNDEFMKEMLRTFIESMPKSIEEIRIFSEKSQWESLGRSIHKVKPSLTMMGLHGTKTLVSAIEEMVKNKRDSELLKDNARKLCAQLESALEELKKMQ